MAKKIGDLERDGDSEDFGVFWCSLGQFWTFLGVFRELSI